MLRKRRFRFLQTKIPAILDPGVAVHPLRSTLCLGTHAFRRGNETNRQQRRPAVVVYVAAKNHWFPLIRPAIGAGYFLGGVALGGPLRFP